jgi:uncharacterized lipoprotein YmbA
MVSMLALAALLGACATDTRTHTYSGDTRRDAVTYGSTSRTYTTPGVYVAPGSANSLDGSTSANRQSSSNTNSSTGTNPNDKNNAESAPTSH